MYVRVRARVGIHAWVMCFSVWPEITDELEGVDGYSATEVFGGKSLSCLVRVGGCGCVGV